MESKLIRDMNERLGKTVQDDEWVAVIDIIARDNNLKLVHDDGGQCRIYRTADGELINCWVDAGEDSGFDDQTEWYTDADADS